MIRDAKVIANFILLISIYDIVITYKTSIRNTRNNRRGEIVCLFIMESLI